MSCKINVYTFQSLLNAVQTLVRIAPDVILPPLVKHITLLLDNPDICLVTRDEYGIFLCPEGELYDKTLVNK